MIIGRRFLLGLVASLFCSVSFAQSTGNCESPLGEAYLETNNVRARIPNTGSLFYNREPHVYRVPRFSNANAIFSSALWVGGMVNGQTHVSASRYGPWEFWAGPLDEQGNAPTDCVIYDRVYSVRRSDLDIFETTGEASRDLADWPTGLGAPTLDAGGDLIELTLEPLSTRKNRLIDLAAGERPALLGDQAVWWVMNDRGNVHESTQSPPVGLEVHGHAYGIASTIAAINNTTMYNYRVFYRGTSRIDSLYFGLWLDHDLGDAGDDYMGSDSLLGMGYAYNADNEDIAGEGYGTPPPALGLMLLQGPSADSDGLDNNRNGLTDEIGERAHVAYVMRVNKSGGNPRTGEDYLNHLKGRWNSGRRMTIGGEGDTYPGTPINYAFPGDPAQDEFWSMVNTDGTGTAAPARDMRFLVSVGPLTLDPGDEFDLTFAIVFALGADHLASVTELKKAAIYVKTAFDGSFFNIPTGAIPSDAVGLLSPGDRAASQPSRATLRWTASDDAEAYDVSLWTGDTMRTYQTVSQHLELDDLKTSDLYFWKVRGLNVFGDGPWSDVWTFDTGNTSFYGLAPVFSEFTVVQNAAGPLDPPEMGAFAFSNSGFPRVRCPDSDELCTSPTDLQQSTNSSSWGIHAGGSEASFGPISDGMSFLGHVTKIGANLEAIGASEYEIRFTGIRGKAILVGSSSVILVPFQLWNIGEDSPDDASDDYRMVPVLCESACGAGSLDGVFDIGGDHTIAGGDNDPATDFFSWFNPANTAPGETGYNDVFDGTSTLGDEVFTDMVLVQISGGSQPPYDVALPETGTVFRITTAPTPPPILAAPGPDAELLPGMIPFYWSGAAFDTYHVQIGGSPRFKLPNYDSEVDGLHFEGLLRGVETYYWRVKGAGSDWSEIGTFKIVQSLAEHPDLRRPDVSSLSNYPNPFRESATIAFTLYAEERVKIEVYDLLGRRVVQLVDQQLTPGRHRIPFDAGRLPSGVYFYRFEAGNYAKTKSMVVAK